MNLWEVCWRRFNGLPNKCYFCDSTDTKFCDMCKESFCDKHRKDPRRMIEFFKKKGELFIPKGWTKEDAEKI